MLQSIRNRVSTKVGLLLLVVFLFIIFSMGGILYSLFLTFYLSHITEELVQRGKSHANVLSEHFTPTTMNHVARMEKGSNYMVVVLDRNRNVIANSDTITSAHREYLSATGEHGAEEELAVEKDWDKKPFLVSRSLIMQNGEPVGAVVMFSPTAPIHQAVEVLQGMLVITGAITVLVVTGIVFLLSRMIVRPLLQIKQATGEIAEGNYSVRLPVQGGDEVAQLAASVNYMSDRIEFYQKQRNEFLADIGHELRTPLTYLKGYAEILRDSSMDSEEQRTYTEIIYEQSSRLQRLVQDLFDLARLEQGTFSFQVERFPLEEAVTDALTLIEPSMDEKGIDLYYEGPDQPLIIRGDRQRLGQVVLNLLENAKRYIPAGSTVRVRVKEHKDAAYIEVEDNGPGIPEEELPYLTERLYRVEKSRSKETGGTGLGLAISQEIIRKHNGSLSIESVKGRGSTFIVGLPLKKDEEL
ncbi:sensor histidine kinase [Aneurinibacillus danicus]|uniref:histidine kinase n=2 Tax=Aneurinibacillus TaxID=55079 RepID=A0A511V9D6_9BACL|nr:HAMP domain-containing sensor histidine kinase [Aneurinibacillus danicus]GEN34851.1 two-component sensor histidine kinase [Aneurinibacillus danicus]